MKLRRQGHGASAFLFDLKVLFTHFTGGSAKGLSPDLIVKISFFNILRYTLTITQECVKLYHIMDHVLIGNHASIAKIRELIGVVSDTAFNVLILGETGTGKEVVARLLHQASSRRNQRFVKVNCAALPLSLLESELFGYEKGAFTGADKLKPGKFELASEGVIYLDEIGDMPLILQAKLLHVLQSGEFNRLGGTRDLKVNAWVVSSTNHNLEEDMKNEIFREDLYYRLNIIKIEMPPLRERREDIPALTDYFIKKYLHESKAEGDFRISDDLKDFFVTYHWPGNVRELASTVLRLMVGDDSRVVEKELLNNMAADGEALPKGARSKVAEEHQRQDRLKDVPQIPRSLKDLKTEATRFIEEKAIIQALDMTAWNKREAARLLKISYKALFNKINSLGIDSERKNSNQRPV